MCGFMRACADREDQSILCTYVHLSCIYEYFTTEHLEVNQSWNIIAFDKDMNFLLKIWTSVIVYNVVFTLA